MTAHPTEQASDVRKTVQRELTSARERHAQLERRRRELERELQAVMAAEEESREGLRSLIAVAHQAGGAVDDVLPLPGDGRIPDDPHVLAGGALRDAITRVALRRNAHGRPVHWKEWFGWLRDAGFDAAGKRAEATFQTQLGRSPLVRRADREGVYVLDVELLARLRSAVLALHQRLAELPPPGQLTLIGDARATRRDLEQQITRAERRLEEAWRMLTEELGSDWNAEREAEPEEVTRLWQERRGSGDTSPETPAADL